MRPLLSILCCLVAIQLPITAQSPAPQKNVPNPGKMERWQMLIQVHQTDAESKKLDPIMFAQKHAEIMLSRSVLLEVVTSLNLMEESAMSERMHEHRLQAEILEYIFIIQSSFTRKHTALNRL